MLAVDNLYRGPHLIELVLCLSHEAHYFLDVAQDQRRDLVLIKEVQTFFIQSGRCNPQENRLRNRSYRTIRRSQATVGNETVECDEDERKYEEREHADAKHVPHDLHS